LLCHMSKPRDRYVYHLPLCKERDRGPYTTMKHSVPEHRACSSQRSQEGWQLCGHFGRGADTALKA
jgi:hypothetical protein